VSAAANDNQAGYTGHIEDAATGLVYMQARYYDPIIGRFLANDPVGFTPGRPDMFNRYAYAGNDPLNQVDPDGKCAGPLIVPCAVGVWEGGTALVTLLGAAVILTSDSVGSEDDPVPVLRPSDGLPIRDGATLERPGEKGRADQIYGKPGGIDEANEDFDQIAEPDSIQDRGEGIRTGKTKNGDSVTVRPNSNDGRATVDVSRGNKGNRETDKYRYGEKKPPAKPNKGETQRVRRTDNQ
jgi:RHS repeat-associated protein